MHRPVENKSSYHPLRQGRESLCTNYLSSPLCEVVSESTIVTQVKMVSSEVTDGCSLTDHLVL